MNYLSFDIECCNGVNLCEFGYVLFDENFNVLEKKCITINPRHKFRLSDRGDGRDMELAFPQSVYECSPEFSYYYDELKKLLTCKNNVVLGFSVRNDKRFLYSACKKYKLPSFEFDCTDIQLLYRAYVGESNLSSVSKIVAKLGLSQIVIHKSDDDAMAVVEILKFMSNEQNIKLPELLTFLKTKHEKFEQEISCKRIEKKLEKIKKGDNREQDDYLEKFIQKVNFQITNSNSVLYRKKIALSSIFQKTKFNEYVALIVCLMKVGAEYTNKVSECEYYVDYVGSDEYDFRKQFLDEMSAKDKSRIKIIGYKDLLDILSIKEAELSKNNWIDASILETRESKVNDSSKLNHVKSPVVASETIGNILKEKGIDTSSIS